MLVADALASDISHNDTSVIGEYIIPTYHIQTSYTHAVAHYVAEWNDPNGPIKTFDFSSVIYCREQGLIQPKLFRIRRSGECLWTVHHILSSES